MPDYDLAIVGAGSAGLSLTYAAARLGLRTALIERGAMGGDCLNVGCVPSKALLAASHAARDARRAARLGITLSAPDPDWPAVRAHIARAIATIEPNDSQARYERLGATVLRGTARFAAPDALDVDGRRLTARRFVIAAGSRPDVPSIPGLDRLPFLTNESLFHDLPRPDHLLVLGGGPVGLEMAQAFAGLGCRVTVIDSGPIAAREDPALVAPLRTTLAAEGITLHEHAEVTEAASDPAGIALVLTDGTRIPGSHLLVATGRRPNIEDLDLPAGAVHAGPRGIATDRGLRSASNPRVFAIGDIADPAGIGPRAFTHVAGYHAGIVIRRAIFRLPARVSDAALPRVTYTAPELAQVGLMENDQPGLKAHCFPLAENDRAIAENDMAGLVKLVERSGRLVGAGIVGPHAGEMIGICTLAISRGLKLSALANMVAPYPTRAEAIKRAAGASYADRLFAPRTARLARLLFRA